MSTDTPVRSALWDAITAYAIACGGDPSKHVYGNTARMKAVSAVERVVDEELSRVTGERNDAVDALDLYRDEMRRILARAAENPDNVSSAWSEMKSHAERALTDIPQRVPVIEQRDKAERERDQVQRELDRAVESVVMIRCTKHVRVPKMNGLAHGGGECGACIQEELAETRRKLEEMRNAVREYLYHSSTDGHPARKAMRAKLGDLAEKGGAA